jgi:hypothetical protein
MEGIKVELELNAVELPPIRYPSKGVCDRAGVFFRDECDTARLSADMVAEAAEERPPLVEEDVVCWAESERAWQRGLL